MTLNYFLSYFSYQLKNKIFPALLKHILETGFIPVLVTICSRSCRDYSWTSLVVNFTKILRSAFSFKEFCKAFLWFQFGFVFFWWKESCTKAARKLLVKLTIGVYFITLYKQLLNIKVFCTAFLYLRFGFCIFLSKGNCHKSCS